MTSDYGESIPEVRGQLENHIEGALSGKFDTVRLGVPDQTFRDYKNFEIVEIKPLASRLETTGLIYFNDRIENFKLTTDNSAREIIDLAIGFPSPGTSVDPGTKVPEEPKKRPSHKRQRRANKEI